MQDKIVYINAPFPEKDHEKIRQMAFKEKTSKGVLVRRLAMQKLSELSSKSSHPKTTK